MMPYGRPGRAGQGRQGRAGRVAKLVTTRMLVVRAFGVQCRGMDYSRLAYDYY